MRTSSPLPRSNSSFLAGVTNKLSSVINSRSAVVVFTAGKKAPSMPVIRSIIGSRVPSCAPKRRSFPAVSMVSRVRGFSTSAETPRDFRRASMIRRS